MWRKSTLIVALILGSSTLALAQGFSGTPQEQAACRPDVGRWCKGVKAEQGNVLECLVAHHQKLSAKCHAVLQGHNQVPAR